MNHFNPRALHRHDQPHELVPRELDENLRFRRELLAWLDEEGETAEQLAAEWCRRDVMFFADAFVWQLDPKRHPGNPLRPWITLPFQEENVFPQIEDSLGALGGSTEELEQIGHDVCIIKSRDVGGTYALLICSDRRFLLYEYQIFVFVSASEELVDDKGNPNSMFPKLDIIHSKLPDFMIRGVERYRYKFSRPEANCIIDGMATTGDVSRSGRPHAVVADEYGAWPTRASLDFKAANIGATNCTIYLSTPHGIGNGFHQVATSEDIPKIKIHWTQHPWHAEGLYHSRGTGGELEFRDQAFWDTARLSWLRRRYPLLARKLPEITGDPPLREVYRFIKDGKERSPYYDNFDLRAGLPWITAQELDMDFVGSGNPFYDHSRLQTILDKSCQVPFRTGRLTWDAFCFEPGVFEDQEGGPLELWLNLVLKGTVLVPPEWRYIIGADVSAGTGASNSCLSVWDLIRREKVASYVRCDLRPERFAEAAFAVHRWFGRAQIIAEGQLHGKDFHARLRDLGCQNLFWMVSVKGVRSQYPGLFLEGGAKESLLIEYGRALQDGEAVCRDRQAIKEAFNFQLTERGTAEHVATRVTKNPGAAKRNHGDRWMADCLAWYRVKRFRNLDRRDLALPAEREPTPAERWVSEDERRYARSRW